VRRAPPPPDNAGWQRDLATSYSKLAVVHRRAGERGRALGALWQGRTIIQHMVSRSPDHTEWKKDLAWFDKQIAGLEK
jgi:hypothetical protein